MRQATPRESPSGGTVQITAEHGMLPATIRVLTACGLAGFLVLAALPLAASFKATDRKLSIAERAQSGGIFSPTFILEGTALAGAAVIGAIALYYLLKRLESFLDADAQLEASFIDHMDSRHVNAAIVVSSALSLFLELALIRWQGSVLEFLAFYKNYSLLACFAGLGLGYALAGKDRIPLLLVLPLLTFQYIFMLTTKVVPGLFHVTPFREQLNMGVGTDPLRSALLYLLLTVVFLITALTFLPIGQLCGRLMERRTKLGAYGLNLLGSLAGVLLMLGASFLWTPPLVWLALCSVAILFFHVRRPVSLMTGIVFTLSGLMVLAWWPVDRLWNRVYSPYQLLEIGTDEDTGLTTIRAAGHYYQRIINLAGPNLVEGARQTREYYDFPYKGRAALDDVAVVGAGTGNDVAAALRAGAKRVDAIEIDPAIMLAGMLDHSEKPYQDPRTHAIVNDARSFLRTTDRKYDLIVYGLLDSHTLLSQGSSVRLDSFVYTIEGLREARNRLKPDGVISLAFTVLSDGLGRKIYRMLQQVFDGRPPHMWLGQYDSSVVFLESNNPHATLPQEATGGSLTDKSAVYANPAIKADISTDDWPFFYMPRRVYPTSYLIMIGQILILSLLLGWSYFGQAPQFSHLSFFFLGVGFMLIETKGITEMGLTFGNTWQVIGIVIAGILIMAFLGNCAVSWLNIKRPHAPYLFLFAALALGWLAARSGGFGSTPLGRLETAILLTCPLLFSGIVFSTLLSLRGPVSGMLAMNLLGAICGGLLEYNSMYFGFRWLYLMAMVCYVLAFASDLLLASRAVRKAASVTA